MTEPSTPFRWSPRRTLLADIAVAGLVALVSVMELVIGGALMLSMGVPIGWLIVVGVLNLATAAALLVRRRRPIAVFAMVIVAGVVVGLAPHSASGVPLIAALVALYTVAAWQPGRRIAWVALGAAVVATVLRRLPDVPDSWGITTAEVAVVVAVWVWGRSRSLRRAYVESLEQRARYLEQAREAGTRAAIAEERTRIARELHDVVAHHVSVMTVQAGAGSRKARREGSATQDNLAAIEHTGREALGELRRLLGVLRADGDGGPPDYREPHKGLADLPELVGHARDAGLDAELKVERSGGPDGVDAGVGLTAYRIVQEALTNVVNHAGPTRVRVVVRNDRDALDIDVIDDGPASAPPPGQRNGSGHGLLGMRERVAMLGGELAAGPRPGGGFEVHARLPAREAR